MRYWWVNQNQTFQQERAGGFIWSPKRNSIGGRNPFYEFMREVAPGDLVLSFVGTFIRAIGIATSYCYECPKPASFGAAGPNWDNIGWKVDIRYRDLQFPMRPADHMARIGPKLPAKYSPLQANGHGLQGVYLTAISNDLMNILADLIGHEATSIIQLGAEAFPIGDYATDVATWEDHLREEITSDQTIDQTERAQLIMARRGQGLFRKNVQNIEQHCRITKVNRPEHLRASHCKPWRDCETHDERLNGENGLLLTPSIDHLFDRGFISFEGEGALLVSPVAHKPSLTRMGVPVDVYFDAGVFSAGQKEFLEYHRNFVFLKASVVT
jgi:hypothetical protein